LKTEQSAALEAALATQLLQSCRTSMSTTTTLQTGKAANMQRSSLPPSLQASTGSSLLPQVRMLPALFALQALAAKQHQLLLQVHQQASSCFSSSTSSTVGRVPSEAEVAWALSMVKSRTFGRPLQEQQQQQQQQYADAGSALLPPHVSCETGSAVTSRREAVVEEGLASGSKQLLQTLPRTLEAQQTEEVEQDGEASDILLLMVPFIDMVNHAQDSNCLFGINWDVGR
jgi:hypothetical protein